MGNTMNTKAAQLPHPDKRIGHTAARAESSVTNEGDVTAYITDAMRQALINPSRPYPISVTQWQVNVSNEVRTMRKTFPESNPGEFPADDISKAGGILLAAFTNREYGIPQSIATDVAMLPNPKFYGVEEFPGDDDVQSITLDTPPYYDDPKPKAKSTSKAKAKKRK